MYDVQTILSAYDKQGTLVQWLKNLDKVLKESGLEAIEKIEVENGVKLVFKFAGGTTIESPVIEKLQKLDLIADSVQLVYESENGVTVEYNANITANNEGINGTINILLPIQGSESVVVDVSEDNTAIQIHLDAEVLQNIERALKIPDGTIPATELVAVTSSKEQKMLTVGEGLKIENDTLSVDNEFFTIELSQAGASGFLSSDDLNQIINNFPNVNIRRLGKTIYTALEFDATTNHYKFANVNTTDTQADTKLILVNGSTGEWTATQYLTDLGGGGLTWREVTIDELQSYISNSDNLGKLVKITSSFNIYANMTGIKPIIKQGSNKPRIAWFSEPMFNVSNNTQPSLYFISCFISGNDKSSTEEKITFDLTNGTASKSSNNTSQINNFKYYIQE